MRFIVRPLCDPDATLDLTDAVVDAVARRLSAAIGGNAVLNRIEAAAHVESLLRRAATSPSAEAGPRPPARTGIGSVKPVEFVEAVEAVEAVNTFEEDLHAIVDTGEAGRERQPQGVVVHRFSLERAG
jgi:hypothetical protein